MKISLNWIKDFVSIPPKYSAQELSDLLTIRTAEVDGYEDQGRGLSGVVVGEVLGFEKYPNADKLNVAQVNIGKKKPLQLIFGQMVKMNVGDRIPVAVAPTILPTGMEIIAKDLRGVRSEGMLCLEQELGFKEEGVSILYFPNIAPGTPLAEALGFDDTVLDVDNKSLTHRPDLWGHYGMAREFSAFLGKPLKKYEDATGVKKVKFPTKGEVVKVKIQTGEISPRFCAVIVTGVRIEDSPQWLQKRLNACGVRPVNNIVDITNYVMLELGQPMHAFDRAQVGTDRLEARYAREGEVLETLDHKKRKLSAEDAVIYNGERVMGLAGIMGGLNSEISRNTTEIIFEAANWNPVMIRKSSVRHGLRSDAAQRFEKSLDPALTLLAIQRACALVLEVCPGAKLAGPVTDIRMSRLKTVSVLLDVEKTARKIGTAIPEVEMIKHLGALGFGIAKVKTGAKKGVLKITVPSWRATKDIDIEDDLVEEIARMHGYEKIKPVLPELPIKLPRPNRERTLKHRSRDILSLGLGFNEASHYSFYGMQEIKRCLLPEALHLRMDNPLTEDQTHMRISLLPYLLKSAALNLRFCEKLKLYEIGHTYIKTSDYFPREEKFICGIVVRPTDSTKTNANADASSTGDANGEIFYESLGALQEFLKCFRAPRMRVDRNVEPPPYAHPSKCAGLRSGKNEIAIVYEVHPQVLKNFGISAECSAFEINFSKLVALGQAEAAYKPLPRFPGIEIDVSVVVDARTPVRDVHELIKKTNTELIERVELIDTFIGKALGDDKKSLTFRVLMQSPDRTLTDEEMKEMQGRIFKTLQEKGFVIRGG